MRTSRALTILPPLILACAQQRGGIVTPPSRVDRVHVESQHVDYDLSSKVEGSETRATIRFSPSDAWQTLPQVYYELAIPVQTHDTAHRLIAGAVSARRSFANKPLSRFVDCGTTAVGPSANAYNVRLTIQTQVDSAGVGEATIRSLVSATAASDGGITVRCASKGDLERLIVDRLSELLR